MTDGLVDEEETLREPEQIENVPRNPKAETYTTKQIGELLQIGESSAGKVMREIKSVSDTLGISGIVHVQDYNYWLQVRLGKGTNYAKAKAQTSRAQRR